MTIQLFVEPQTPPMKWKKFLKQCQPFSIALDGYVEGPPARDNKKVVQNFNHHEGVDRLSTLCTCAQVLKNIRFGLPEKFRNAKGQVEMKIFVNDCDEDVCLSVFLLRNMDMVRYPLQPLVNRLVNAEDLLDSTSGAYPLPKDMKLLRELAWIFEPYRRARTNGLLATKDPAVYEGIIDDVGNRIMAHLTGNGHEIDIDTTYEVIGGGKGWNMIKEIGNYARTGMYADKILAFVSVKERKNGSWDYVIGRQSPYVDFEIDDLYKILNEKEGATNDRWGGSEIIGGSPRVGGSKLSPKEVEELINQFIGKKEHIV